jgi:hypothetical protein
MGENAIAVVSGKVLHMPLEIHGGDYFPAQRAPQRLVQLAGCPPLAELPQQLHLAGLAGGIFVGTSQP